MPQCYRADDMDVTLGGGRVVYFRGPAPVGSNQSANGYAWETGTVSSSKRVSALLFTSKARIKAGKRVNMSSINLGHNDGPNAGKVLVEGFVFGDDIQNVQPCNITPCS